MIADPTVKSESVGNIVEKDSEEKEFERLLRLWVDGQISYETLIHNLPTYDSSMPRKLIKALLRQLT